MNPIEELRKDPVYVPGRAQGAPTLSQIADEIGRAYMKLPTDMDGEPIRPGDTVVFTNGASITGKVEAVGETWVAFGDRPLYGCKSCRKADGSIEGIIQEAMQYAFSEPYRSGNLYIADKVKEYADRIRALEGAAE